MGWSGVCGWVCERVCGSEMGSQTTGIGAGAVGTGQSDLRLPGSWGSWRRPPLISFVHKGVHDPVLAGDGLPRQPRSQGAGGKCV